MRLLNAEPGRFSDESIVMLKEHFEYSELSKCVALVDAGFPCEILLTKLAHTIDREVIDAFPALRYIATPTTGLTHVDVEYAAEKGIEVLSLKGDYEFLRSITATAELAWCLILALARGLPLAVADVACGNWDRNAHIGMELSGRVLGILGLGRLGSMIASYGKAFGMRVLATDPAPSCGLVDGVEMVCLESLLASADVVTVHVDLNPTTRHLIGGKELNLFKKSAYLVNTSRGEVLDEEALAAALRERRIAGAALDVLEKEFKGYPGWPASDPLVAQWSEYGRLIITPHIGGATTGSMQKADMHLAVKLCNLD
jgi:D-3-phosphoglycerate dehydrogenase